MLPALFLSFLLFSSLRTCLAQCFTSLETKRLECSNLHKFPREVGPIEVLQATNNTFTTIAPNTLQQQQFSSLKAAILRFDNIWTVARLAFNGLNRLLLLDLTGNKLRELPAESFEGATSVKILILARNRLQGLHLDCFVGLNNLIFLDLSHNNLTQIPTDVLAPLPLIKYLDITGNPLALSRPGPLLASRTLAVLRVSLLGNEGIPPELFTFLPNLQVLDLSGSRLKAWPAPLLGPLPSLRVLYVDDLINGDPLVPTTVEKIVQSEMDVTSGTFVSKILENLAEFNTSSKDEEFLQYLEDYITDNGDFDPDTGPNWQFPFKKCLLFALLAYLSLMYCLCLSQPNENSADIDTDNNMDAEENISEGNNSSNNFREPEPKSKPMAKKKRLSQLTSMVSQLKEITETVNTKTTEEENEFEVFGKHVGLQLKAMPLIVALEAQEHIQLYINQIRRQQLQNASKQNRYNRSSTPSSFESQPSPSNSITSNPTSTYYTEDYYSEEQHSQEIPFPPQYSTTDGLNLGNILAEAMTDADV